MLKPQKPIKPKKPVLSNLKRREYSTENFTTAESFISSLKEDIKLNPNSTVYVGCASVVIEVDDVQTLYEQKLKEYEENLKQYQLEKYEYENSILEYKIYKANEDIKQLKKLRKES